MGNCCGGESKDANFSGAGRTLGSQPAPNPESTPPRVAVPAKVGGPPRTLGGDGSGEGSDPKSAAARAAEVPSAIRHHNTCTNHSTQARASAANAPKGKLGAALAEQKKQTRTNTLEAAAQQERQARTQDENLQALQHN